MFEYLSTTDGVNRYVFYVAIGWCIWEAALVLSKPIRVRLNNKFGR